MATYNYKVVSCFATLYMPFAVATSDTSHWKERCGRRALSPSIGWCIFLLLWMLSSSSSFVTIRGFESKGRPTLRWLPSQRPPPASAIRIAKRRRRNQKAVSFCSSLRLAAAAATTTIADFQSDATRYGRGDHHLSAALSLGDVVVYQTGSWFVDGVLVGDDAVNDSALAKCRYCCMETIQVVWTHNCEHGVLRGMELIPTESTTTTPSAINGPVQQLVLQSTGVMVEFGPEQLLARIPVEWILHGPNGEDDDDDRSNARQQQQLLILTEDSCCLPLLHLEPDKWVVL